MPRADVIAWRSRTRRVLSRGARAKLEKAHVVKKFARRFPRGPDLKRTAPRTGRRRPIYFSRETDQIRLARNHEERGPQRTTSQPKR